MKIVIYFKSLDSLVNLIQNLLKKNWTTSDMALALASCIRQEQQQQQWTFSILNAFKIKWKEVKKKN